MRDYLNQQQGAAAVRGHRRHRLRLRQAKYPYTDRLAARLPRPRRRSTREYLKTEKPNAKVAVLYQNDGFGKDLLGGFTEGIKGSGDLVVAQRELRGDRPHRRAAGEEAGRVQGRRRSSTSPRRRPARRRSPRSRRPAGSRCTSSTPSPRPRRRCSSRSASSTRRASSPRPTSRTPEDPQWANDAGDEGATRPTSPKYAPDADPTDPYSVYGWLVGETHGAGAAEDGRRRPGTALVDAVHAPRPRPRPCCCRGSR